MQTQVFTNCIRCGKVRIFGKKWTEKVDNKGSVLTHESSICPDADCQKEVDAKFQEMRDKRELMEENRRNKTHPVKVN